MADIAFPTTSKGLERLPKTRQILKNCWNTGEAILSRPGITSLATISGLARGQFVWNENLYAIYGTTLYRMGTDGTTTSIGTIAGAGLIDFAIGFNEAAIVVRDSTGNGYTLNSSETLTQITDPDFVASNSVTHINGRFVYVPYNGDPAFFSEVGAAGTIEALSFFDAEELPDKNKVAFNWRNILIIGGTDSFELFRDVGTVTVPYQRLNARVDFGYIGGLTQYADSYAFVGREIGQDVGIYILDKGSATKISNDHIDLILSEYTEAELANAIGSRFKWRGFDILTFTLARHAFGYYQGWFDLDTQISGVSVPWRAGFITQFKQKYYTARASNFGRLDRINTDYGNPFERLIETGFYNESNNDFTAQSIELGISQGYNVFPQSSSLAIENIDYENKQYDFTEAASALKLLLNNDGTKAYVLGGNLDDVFEYTLSTAWDISTASYNSVSLDLSSQGGSMIGLDIASTGLKMYSTDVAGDAAYQYDLTSAFDLSTASYASKTLSLSSQTSNPRGISLSADGNYAFVVDSAVASGVYRYDLSTAYDISTGSYNSNTINITAQTTNPRDARISSDGYTLWVNTDSDLYEYALTTAYDLTTASLAKTVSFSGSALYGFWVDETEKKLYAIQNTTDIGFQWDISLQTPIAQTVGLALSRDNVLYSDVFYREVGALGRYSDKLMWNYPGGLGYYEGFMGVRLTTTDDVEFSCDKFTVNSR